MSNRILENTTVGFGAMSLCIKDNRPSMSESIAMIEQLLDQEGLDFIDTADCYCLDEDEFGYGESIVAKFIHDPRVTIATKGGFTRPGAKWVPRGDPAYLRSACEASLKRLGTDVIELYQYHTPDPNVPYEDSLGEIVCMRDEGKIKNIGVSNATLDQLKLAKEMAGVRSVQNPLSIIFYKPEDYDPILDYCEQNQIRFIAYAPLGGHRNPYVMPTVSSELNLLAESLNLTVYQLALLTLCALSDSIIPITGSQSKQHIVENLAIRNPSLSQETLEQIVTLMELPERNRISQRK